MITVEIIEKLLKEYPDGLKAEEIASKLGLSVIYLKSFLYSNECKEVLVRDDNLVWALKNKHQAKNKKEHWFLSKFQNKENSKFFSLDDFNLIADWSCGKSPSGRPIKKVKTKCGNIIECDSQSEIKILDYLDRSGVVGAVGGQALTIDYPTFFTKHNDYSPDLALITTDNRIAILLVIEQLNNAIRDRKKIACKVFDLNYKGNIVYRHSKRTYKLEPIALIH